MPLHLGLKIFGFIIIAFAIVIIALLAIAWDALGTRPSADDVKRFEKSPQWQPDRKLFDNRIPNLRANIQKRLTVNDYYDALIGSKKDVTPTSKLPEAQLQLAEFLKPADVLKVIWFGHSTLMLNINGKIILIDPIFSGYASPLWFSIQRFQASMLSLEEIPAIDYVVISHDHYDHLDMATIKSFVGKPTQFIVPLGIGSHLKGWGIKQEAITELDWWQNVSKDGLEFISTPAQHFSGRTGMTDGETLWTSWVIKNSKFNLYFSGDSGYDIHFKEIGKKYGPFDIAFLENGQYSKLWPEVHLLPEDVIRAYQDLGAKRVFPVHWGMFKLSSHTWFEPITLLAKAAKENNMPLISPKLGQTVLIDDNYVNETWWESLISKEK